jgi:ABC-type cobalamin transport system permease subunit
MSIKIKILGLALKYLGKKLDGRKTYLGGVGLILTGVVGLIGHIVPDMNLPKVSVDNALASISAGLAVFGIGHKIEKAGA